MEHFILPPALYIGLSYLFYVIYEYTAVESKNKDISPKLLKEYDSRMKEVYDSPFGKTIRHFVHVFNSLIALVLLLLLYQHLLLGIVIFCIYNAYFLLKIKKVEGKESVSVYIWYHIPFYLALTYDLIMRGVS